MVSNSNNILFYFRISSAAALGQIYGFSEDLDLLSLNFVGLEKHSRVGRLRSSLKLPNGLTDFKVKINRFTFLRFF